MKTNDNTLGGSTIQVIRNPAFSNELASLLVRSLTPTMTSSDVDVSGQIPTCNGHGDGYVQYDVNDLHNVGGEFEEHYGEALLDDDENIVDTLLREYDYFELSLELVEI